MGTWLIDVGYLILIYYPDIVVSWPVDDVVVVVMVAVNVEVTDEVNVEALIVVMILLLLVVYTNVHHLA